MMIEKPWINLPQLEKEKLDRDGFYMLPKLISEDDALKHEQETRLLPVRWVYTAGLTEMKYQSQMIPPNSRLCRLFLDKKILAAVNTALGLTATQKPKDILFWIHRYELGQYITEHKDKAGDIQLLLSLTQPPKENGGELFIKKDGETTLLTMSTGDAALLYANRYVHYSNPLVESSKIKNPTKVIAVARYYF